jgi:hypothetical protein
MMGALTIIDVIRVVEVVGLGGIMWFRRWKLIVGWFGCAAS